jgi:hypothetical protein
MMRDADFVRRRMLGVSRSSPANLWDTVVAMWVCGTRERSAFSYNKRTMDRAMGPFLPLWQFLESITYVLSTRLIVRLPSPSPIFCLLSISYGHFLISYNSILRKRVFRRAGIIGRSISFGQESLGRNGYRFRTAILGQDLVSSCLPTIQELWHCGSDRDAESRHLPLRTQSSWPHGLCIGRFDFRHQIVKPLFSSGGRADLPAHLKLFSPFLRIYNSFITGSCLLHIRNS